MNTEINKNHSTVEIEEVQDSNLFLQSKLENRVLKYFQNKDIMKEYSDSNQLILEEIQDLFQKSDEKDILIKLPNDSGFVRLTEMLHTKDRLDKESLAETINNNSDKNQGEVSKDDLKTPWDYSMLTKQGRLTPKMVSEHMVKETGVKFKLSKSKKKPKNFKNNQEN